MKAKKIGTDPAKRPRQTWVQTERAAHEAWASLIKRHSTAAMVLHHLVARMGAQNAIVISRSTLARIIGVSPRTVTRAIEVLVRDKWLEVLRIGGRENAYVVNSRVAWCRSRKDLVLAAFDARVIVDAEDQTRIDETDLRALPTLYPGEMQIPAGTGEEPPAQTVIDGTADLPTRSDDNIDQMWIPGTEPDEDDA